MKKNNILGFGLIFVASSCVLAMAQVPGTTNSSAEAAPEVSASDESGSTVIRWRMPPRDSALLLDAAQTCGDDKFRRDLLLSFQRQGARSGSSQLPGGPKASGSSSVDRAKADFVIDRSFSDKQGTHALYLKMPAYEALGILKSTFLVGDARLKYQVMHFGFRKYEQQDVRTDILSFLSGVFDQQDVMTKGEVLFAMFAMDPHSPQTLAVIEKAKSISGDGKAESFVRQAALDMQEYLKTGDRSLLDKYNVTL